MVATQSSQRRDKGVASQTQRSRRCSWIHTRAESTSAEASFIQCPRKRSQNRNSNNIEYTSHWPDVSHSTPTVPRWVIFTAAGESSNEASSASLVSFQPNSLPLYMDRTLKALTDMGLSIGIRNGPASKDTEVAGSGFAQTRDILDFAP